MSTRRALYFSMVLSAFRLILNTHLEPIAPMPLGNFAARKSPRRCIDLSWPSQHFAGEIGRTVDCAFQKSGQSQVHYLNYNVTLHTKRMVALNYHLDRRFSHFFLRHLQKYFCEYLISVDGDGPRLVPVNSIPSIQFGDWMNRTYHPLLNDCACRSNCKQSEPRRHR